MVGEQTTDVNTTDTARTKEGDQLSQTQETRRPDSANSDLGDTQPANQPHQPEQNPDVQPTATEEEPQHPGALLRKITKEYNQRDETDPHREIFNNRYPFLSSLERYNLLPANEDEIERLATMPADKFFQEDVVVQLIERSKKIIPKAAEVYGPQVENILDAVKDQLEADSTVEDAVEEMTQQHAAEKGITDEEELQEAKDRAWRVIAMAALAMGGEWVTDRLRESSFKEFIDAFFSSTFSNASGLSPNSPEAQSQQTIDKDTFKELVKHKPQSLGLALHQAYTQENGLQENGINIDIVDLIQLKQGDSEQVKLFMREMVTQLFDEANPDKHSRMWGIIRSGVGGALQEKHVLDEGVKDLLKEMYRVKDDEQKFAQYFSS